MNKITILLIIASSLFSYFPVGQTGGLPGEFLNYYSNAKSAGIAGAYIDHEPGILYFNPAGIKRAQFIESSIFVAPLFMGSRFLSFSFVTPLFKSEMLGLSIFNISSGEAERTNSIGESLGYKFSGKEIAFIVSYAREIEEMLDAGLNLKFIYQNIDTFSANGIGADIGLLYYPTDKLTYSLRLQNIIPPKLGKDIYPLSLDFGIKRITNYNLSLSIIAAVRGIFRTNYLRCAAGVEYTPIKVFSFRAGINHREISFGFGILTGKLDFDYALTIHPLSPLHRFSINIKYGLSPSETEKRLKEELKKLEAFKEELKKERELLMEFKKRERDKLKSEMLKLKKTREITLKLISAKEFFEKGDYKRSEKIIKEILQIDPKNEEARKLEAEIKIKSDLSKIEKILDFAEDYYNQQNYTSAAREAENILKLQPNNKRANILFRLSKARILISQGKYSSAESKLHEILKIEPTHEEAIKLLKRLRVVLEILHTK